MNRTQTLQTLLTSLFLLISLHVFGQTRTVAVSVYFDSDRSVLRTADKDYLTELLDSLQASNAIEKVVISGHTDNSASDEYNIKLSGKRSGALEHFLLSAGLSREILLVRFFGESRPVATNDNEPGKQRNRRVDLSIVLQPTDGQSPATAEEEVIIPKDTCLDRDTTIDIDGFKFTFNRCEYLGIAECIEIQLLNSSAEVRDADLTLLDDQGRILSSCGMFNLKMVSDCNRKRCLDQPVKVLVPVDQENCNICRGSAGLYDLMAGGSWRRDTRITNTNKIVKIEGHEFYVFYVSCFDNMKNCDCVVMGRKIKFKAPRGYEIVEVRYMNDCPLVALEFSPDLTKRFVRKNVAKGMVACIPGDKEVSAIIVDRSGKTLVLPLQPLNNLPHRVFLSRCGKDRSDKSDRILGFIPTGKRNQYRKYKIKKTFLEEPKDLQLAH